MYDTYMMTHGTRTFLRIIHCYLHGIRFQLRLIKIIMFQCFYSCTYFGLQSSYSVFKIQYYGTRKIIHVFTNYFNWHIFWAIEYITSSIGTYWVYIQNILISINHLNTFVRA